MPDTKPPPVNPEDIQPTDAEIEAAARTEAEQSAAATAAKPPAAAKKGPGRPPGSKNRSTKETDARAAGAKTRATVVKPDVPKAEIPDADLEAARIRAAKRKQRTADLTAEIKGMRPEIAKTLAMASGIPAHFFVQPQITENGRPVIDAASGEPVEDLTPYGAMIVPSDGQIKMVARGIARAEESEVGAQLAERLERFAPAFFMLAGLGVCGVYAYTAAATLQALKPQIAQEIAAMAEAQAAGNTPG